MLSWKLKLVKLNLPVPFKSFGGRRVGADMAENYYEVERRGCRDGGCWTSTVLPFAVRLSRYTTGGLPLQ